MNESDDEQQAPNSETPSPNAAFVTGLIVGGIGLLILLSALGVLPFSGWSVPRPVAGVVGVTLIAGGLAAWQHVWPEMRILRSFATFAFAGLVATAGWIGFGPGQRACSSSLGALGISVSRDAAEWECRGAFGFFAILFGALLLWGMAAEWRRMTDDAPWAVALEKLAKAVAMTPILVLVFVALLVALPFIGVDAFKNKVLRWWRKEPPG